MENSLTFFTLTVRLYGTVSETLGGRGPYFMVK